MELLFDVGVAIKILGFFLIIDLAILPILLLLECNLAVSYLPIILFEGFCSLVLGGVRIFNSLFSTIERENHKYIGDGFTRYELKSITLLSSQKRRMRIQGVTMVITGLLLISLPFILTQIQNYTQITG